MKKVRWELHILPMMRTVDRDHMLRLGGARRLDLLDYDQVRARATPDAKGKNVFFTWIESGHMPPPDGGGPWPPEWIALFKRWATDDGFARLELGEGTYTAVRSGSTVKLVAKVTLPSVDDSAWLDRPNAAASPREYVLWLEPNADPDEPFETTTSDTFDAPPEMTVLYVTDKNGKHEVPIK